MSQRLKHHRRGSTSEDYADIEKVRGRFRGVCKRNGEARSIFEESLLSDLHNSLYLPVHALSSVNSVHTVIRSFATTSCTGRAGIRVGLDLPRSRDVRARLYSYFRLTQRPAVRVVEWHHFFSTLTDRSSSNAMFLNVSRRVPVLFFTLFE